MKARRVNDWGLDLANVGPVGGVSRVLLLDVAQRVV